MQQLRIEAGSYETEDSRLLQLVQFPGLAAIIASRKTLSAELMAAIAASGSHDGIYSMLIHHGPIPTEVFAAIWNRHPNSVIRTVLARHPFTPVQILERLAFDAGPGVAKAFQQGRASAPMKAVSELYHRLATAEALGRTSTSLCARAIRAAGGISTLARVLGVTPRTVQQWQNGTRQPRPRILERLQLIAECAE